MASDHISDGERGSEETAEEREERDHLLAFGHLDDFHFDTLDKINKIKNNDPTFTFFDMTQMHAADMFSDLAWELLGRYIANNVRLEAMILGGYVNDLPAPISRRISLIFKHLKGSKSLKHVNFEGDNFGLIGIHNMVPFLGNSPHLTMLSISNNDNFDSACLEVVLEALDGVSIQKLILRACDITDITAFEHAILPELQVLDLSHNGITRIPVLGDYSNLTHLALNTNNIQTIPFASLDNCTNLQVLSLESNENFDSTCLQVVLRALDGVSIQKLKLRACNITDTTAFEHIILPELQVLDLSHNGITRIPVLGHYSNLTHLKLNTNNIQTIPFASLDNCTNLQVLSLESNGIGKDAYQSIAELLRCGSLSLAHLNLRNNNIDDEGVKIIARSLRHNTTLTHLSLEFNDVTIESSKAFSALLNDVTTIDATYKSNHTLTNITQLQNWSFQIGIANPTDINEKFKGDAHGAGRAKVIATHLNREVKRKLCRLQNVNYSYSSVLAGIDPILLPNLLALTSRVNGQYELYCMLVATAHDVASTMDKKLLLKELIAKKSSELGLLAAEIADLNKRLNAIEPDGTSRPRVTAIGTKKLTRGKKRARNASL